MRLLSVGTNDECGSLLKSTPKLTDAEESFLDEMAEALGKDPIEFRPEMLKRAKEATVGKNNEYDADRYAGVLTLVRDKAGWSRSR